MIWNKYYLSFYLFHINPIGEQLEITVPWNIKINSNRICNFLTNPKTCFLTTFFKKGNLSGKKLYLSLKSYKRKKNWKEISSSTTFNSLSKLIWNRGERGWDCSDCIYFQKV